MGKSIKIGNTSFNESCRELTYDQFKELVLSSKAEIGINIDKAYDIIQGCDGCKDKKVKKVVKKKTVKKKP